MLSDIPGRDKPLQPRELLRYQKENIEVLKMAINKGLLSGNFSKILSLREVPSGVILAYKGKTKFERLVELSDSQLQNLQSMDTSDMLFDVAVGLAKCNPEKVKILLETMENNGCRYYANCCLREANFDLAYKMFKEIDEKTENHTTELTPRMACRILDFVSPENKFDAEKLFDNRQELGITADKIPGLIQNNITKEQIRKAIKYMGRSKVAKLSNTDFVIACQFADLYNKTSINEIPMSKKKDLLRILVSSNIGLFKISEELSKDFPLMPRNQEEYCSLLPSIVRSLGIETNPLTPQRVEVFNKQLDKLSENLAGISDKDFANLHIRQEFSNDDFVKVVLEKVKDLNPIEKQKVFDYFGFELIKNTGNETTGHSIYGYPVNLNNGKKLAEITDPNTRAVVENLRADVIRFSQNNRIKCENPQVETLLNQAAEVLPEIRTMIGKKQHGTHDYDVMQHSLKVMQKILQNPKFKTLNDSDQKIMLLASLLHDITKREGFSDRTHASNGSFDTFFIAKKFNLTRAEEIKLFTLVRHHEWLNYVNTSNSQIQLTKRLQSVAFDMQHDNLFDMAMMFTHADLKAVKADDTFHDTREGASRAVFDENNNRIFEANSTNGVKKSHGEAADIYAEKIREYIHELKKTRPLTPTTKIPTMSEIRTHITNINPDGSTNLKGVYVDTDGLIVIKVNDVENWEALGFPHGTTTKGILANVNNKGEKVHQVETGNFKLMAHGLDYPNQLAKFDAFSLPDSETLLSITYMERPETKSRNFRPQGVGLDFDSKYIYGGGETDAGSGCGKTVDDFKDNYIFGGRRESDRRFVSDIVKEANGMTDEEYIEFYDANEGKSWNEFSDKEAADNNIRAFAENIHSTVRGAKRAYTEFYGSNPKRVNSTWVYSLDPNEIIGNPLEFLHRTELTEGEENSAQIGAEPARPVAERTQFLREFSLNQDHDVPMLVFGD